MTQQARRFICLLAVTLVGIGGIVTRGWSNILVAPGATGEEGPLGSTVVALPLNPVSALFQNPAQLDLLPPSFTFGPAGMILQPSYSGPRGYDNTSREVPVGGNFGYMTDRWAPLRVGVGMYGSVGFTFNFPSDPDRGIPNNLVSEAAIVAFPLAVSYPLTTKLHVGVALNPTYGRARFKSPSPLGRLDIDVRGAGVFGTVGVLYQLTPKLNIGLGYKTHGTTWMFGNARVGGRGDDATLDFQSPSTVTFGIAYWATDRLTLTAQGRWTQFSVFENSDLEFDIHTVLDRPAVDDARDIWRFGTGMLYEFFPGIKLLTAFSWEQAGIKASSLTPIFFDTEEYIIGTGISVERGRWRLTIGSNMVFNTSRKVSADKNAFFPGRYDLHWIPFAIQFTRRLDLPH
jgi:long-subunit fatty acid transport protein